MTKPTTTTTATLGLAWLLAASAALAGNDPEARFKGTGKADPIRIENVSVKPAGVEGASTIALDLAWDWSWRAAWEVGEEQHGSKGTLRLESWDAAWVFVKFRKPGDEWAHATLAAKAADHRVPAGAALDVGLNDDGDRGLGVFIYRSALGSGPNDWKGVALRWLHAAAAPAPDAANIKVLALRMVHVPQCAFWAGDGTTDQVASQFSAGDSDKPFRVDSEGAITLGGESPQHLGNRDSLGMDAGATEDFHSSRTRRLPEAFPKGYAAFYCMRHEMTQREFVEFLNTLPYERQAALMDRKPSDAAGTFIGGSPETGSGRNGILIAVPGTAGSSEVVVYRHEPFVASATVSKPSTPAVYETLLPHVACNFITHRDGAAFAAWAGLRPMTELEFEKACRGPLKPVANEYAWGTDAIAGAEGGRYTLQNPGQPDETVAWTGDNGPDAARGNALCSKTDKEIGALRAGIFAAPDSDRVRAGASYWGILDLSGNLQEAAVPVGSPAGRAFAGTHGDGIDAPWRASVFGLRGGGLPYGSHAALWGIDEPFRVSNRRVAVKPGPYNADKRHFSAGFRCVRTAP